MSKNKKELVKPGVLQDSPTDTPPPSTLVFSSQFAGPFPPPQVLAEYAAVDPKLVEQIFARAESEQAHRHKIEDRHSLQFERVVTQGFYAQCYAFILAMTAIIVGGILVYNGHSGSGIASIVGSLVLLVSAFIAGKVIDAKAENESKSAE